MDQKNETVNFQSSSVRSNNFQSVDDFRTILVHMKSTENNFQWCKLPLDDLRHFYQNPRHWSSLTGFSTKKPIFELELKFRYPMYKLASPKEKRV